MPPTMFSVEVAAVSPASGLALLGAVTRTLMGAALVIGAAISLAACAAEDSVGLVVHSSDRDGNPELYVMDLDGGSSTRLTDNDFFDGNPDWSPDGSRIAFTSDGDGNLDLYVMDADGSDVARLTRDAGYQGASDWSPDGSQLVYDADDEEGILQVFVTDIAGDIGATQLTSGAANGTPVWSPDGDQIAFTSGTRRRPGDLCDGGRRRRAGEPHQPPRR